jgi:hypothetical protein
MGTNPRERIANQEGWDMATAELEQLWHQSGHKRCVSCEAMVLPSRMLPPGPGNVYPWHCRSCARIASETSHRRVFGPAVGPLNGPQKIVLKDGSRITLAELARRCRERTFNRDS